MIDVRATAPAPTWRCAALGCQTLTLQLHCDHHRAAFEQLLDEVLASRASADTTTTAAHAVHPAPGH